MPHTRRARGRLQTIGPETRIAQRRLATSTRRRGTCAAGGRRLAPCVGASRPTCRSHPRDRENGGCAAGAPARCTRAGALVVSCSRHERDAGPPGDRARLPLRRGGRPHRQLPAACLGVGRGFRRLHVAPGWDDELAPDPVRSRCGLSRVRRGALQARWCPYVPPQPWNSGSRRTPGRSERRRHRARPRETQGAFPRAALARTRRDCASRRATLTSRRPVERASSARSSTRARARFRCSSRQGSHRCSMRGSTRQ